MDIAKEYGWKYITTFKEDSMPDRYEEFRRLKGLCLENTVEVSSGKLIQKYSWVNEIEHKGNSFDALELVEKTLDKKTRFVFMTNIGLIKTNIEKIAKGGRLRWKIENEGFNLPKKWGI